MLPATKSVPKEMLPVGRKPVIQYVIEEMAANGIDSVLFVTGHNKRAIADHFGDNLELTRALQAADKRELLKELEFEMLDVCFSYTRQPAPRGLGDAVLCAEEFAGDEPFVVALGDTIVGLRAPSRAVIGMAALLESKHADCVIAVDEVSRENVSRYGIIAPGRAEDQFVSVTNVVEKPNPANAPAILRLRAGMLFLRAYLKCSGALRRMPKARFS